MSRCFALLLILILLVPEADAAPVVRVDSGLVAGSTVDGVDVFKGIPYAAPPVGRRRWAPPQPVADWRGVRAATRYGHDCVQLPIPGDAGASGSSLGEDCLYVNVWRPAGTKAGARLPVMVWIHGGGYLNGAASVPFFDGSEFARDGIVMVSFNYRLGRLGFFAHPALSAAPERPLANYALMDQLAALWWVKRNIADFGGHPNHVTVVGESAGGISVVHLLTWPAARGLFQRAAVLSGGGRSYLMQTRRLAQPSGDLPSAEQSGVDFARSRGITDTGAAGLAALRALPAQQVNGDLSMAALLTRPETYAGGPVVDGDIVSAQPQEHFLRGEFSRMPLLVGTTGADLPGEFPPDPAHPLDFFGPNADRARELYDPRGQLPVDKLATLVAVDMTMQEPARFLARRMTLGAAPAWLYRFDYVADALRPTLPHAPHAGELCYLFDQLDARYGQAVTDHDRAMAKSFHAYFVNFVKSGDPNGAGLPSWPRFDPSTFDLMTFDDAHGARFGPDPWGERIGLVERARERRGTAQPGPATR